MFEEFFLLNDVGDTILYRNMFNEARLSHSVQSFRTHVVDKDPQSVEPFHTIDGKTHFAHIYTRNLYFVVSSNSIVAPSFAIDTLEQISNIFLDYCGSLNEDALRLNVVLLYELLDEVIDCGYVQATSSERLRSFVFNEPAMTKAAAPSAGEMVLSSLGVGANATTTAATNSHRPITIHEKSPIKQRDALFVDIFERLTMQLDVNGQIERVEVDGRVSMRSDVRGSPLVRLSMAKHVSLQNVRLGARVSRELWDSEAVLQVHAGRGNVALLRYRAALDRTATSSGGMPLQLAGRASINHIDESTCMLSLRLRAVACVDARHRLAHIVTRVRVPASASLAGSRCTARTRGTALSNEASLVADADGGRSLLWRAQNVAGATELLLAVDIPVEAVAGDRMALKGELGPLTCSFDVPMWTASGLSLRLRIDDNLRQPGVKPPASWIRSLTESNSFVRPFEWMENNIENQWK